MDPEIQVQTELEVRNGAAVVGVAAGSSTLDNLRRFRELCIAYSEYGRKAGVMMLPYREGSNQRFATLPPEWQAGIISNLETSVEICASAIENNIDIRKGSLSLVWWSLRKFGLRPPSDLFSYVKEGDILEIYNEQNIQIFRSFNLFEFLSYSIEELFSHEWWELFKRDDEVTRSLQGWSEEIIKGGRQTPIILDNQVHWVEERFSVKRNLAKIQTCMISPVFSSATTIRGYLSCTRLVKFASSQVDNPGVSRVDV